MDWIKAKYDRVLLGFCGVAALAVGGLLLMNTLGWKKQFPALNNAAGNRSDFGTTDSGKRVESALTQLKAEAKVSAPKIGDRDISLFTSAPVVKKAGESDPIAILDPKSKQVREGIDNAWLYYNDLDLRRVDIADLDSDGDHFSNKDEFAAKTNPRDANSHPSTADKIVFKELVEEKLSIRLNAVSGPNEITFRVTAATPEASYTTKFLGAGGKIQATKGGEDRFVVTKIDTSSPGKEFAVLDDIKSGKKGITAAFKADVDFPTYRAKLAFNLGTEEVKEVSVGDEVSFAADAEQKYTVKEITPSEVVVEFAPAGKTEKETKHIKIATPP